VWDVLVVIVIFLLSLVVIVIKSLNFDIGKSNFKKSQYYHFSVSCIHIEFDIYNFDIQ